jgi:hypothetical protein
MGAVRTVGKGDFCWVGLCVSHVCVCVCVCVCDIDVIPEVVISHVPWCIIMLVNNLCITCFIIRSGPQIVVLHLAKQCSHSVL